MVTLNVGEARTLLLNREDGKGTLGHLTVGCGQPAKKLDIGPSVARSFVHALRAIVTLTVPPGKCFNATAPSFLNLGLQRFVSPGGATVGESAGAAMCTALAGHLLARELPENVAATGEVEADGTVKPVGGEDVGNIMPKVIAFVRRLQKQGGGTRPVVLLAEDDYNLLKGFQIQASTQPVRDARELLEGVGVKVDELQQAAQRSGWFREAPSSLGAESAELSDLFWGDWELVRAFGVYLIGCIEGGTQEVRAPDITWRSLDEVKRHIGTEDMADQIEVLRVPSLARHAALERRLFEDDNRLSALWLPPVFAALSASPEQRTDLDTAGLNVLQWRLLFDHFQELRGLLTNLSRTADRAEYSRRLVSLFLRNERLSRPKMAIITGKEVASEDAMAAERGRPLVSATLGGAWLVTLALHGFQCKGLGRPDPSKLHEDTDEAFGYTPRGGETHEDFIRRTDQRYAAFIQGLQHERGEFALFLERPWHPRVLWEVLSRENIRYPAEKLVMCDWFRALRENGTASVRTVWSFEMLPPVGDVRKAHSHFEDSRDGTRLYDPNQLRVGHVHLQDYAAYARTNYANWFLRWQLQPIVLPLDVESTIIGEDELGDIGFTHVQDLGAGARVGGVLNARSSHVAALESLRRQVEINDWLSQQDPDAVPLDRLLSVAWTRTGVMREVRAPDSLMTLLGGPPDAGAIATSLGPGDYLPRFDNPYTWRGCGLASSWAYEATIALTMRNVLRKLERSLEAEATRAAPGDTRAGDLYRDAAVSRFEVERYLRHVYPSELARMRSLVARVRSLCGGPELEQALARIDAVRTRLSDAGPAVTG